MREQGHFPQTLWYSSMTSLSPRNPPILPSPDNRTPSPQMDSEGFGFYPEGDRAGAVVLRTPALEGRPQIPFSSPFHYQTYGAESLLPTDT